MVAAEDDLGAIGQALELLEKRALLHKDLVCRQRLEASGHPACLASAAMIAHVNRIYGEVYGADGAALHDPCTIGYLLDPGLFSCKMVPVTVSTTDDDKRGNTALGAEGAAGINWITGLDDDALFELLVTSMERL